MKLAFNEKFIGILNGSEVLIAIIDFQGRIVDTRIATIDIMTLPIEVPYIGF